MTAKRLSVLISCDCPAAANEAIVRRCPNVANPQIIPAVALVELRVGYSPPGAMGSSRRRKRRQIKPTDEMRNVLCDRRNNMVNKGLSARLIIKDVKPNPASAVASGAIRPYPRPIATGGAAFDHGRRRFRRTRSSGTIVAAPATMTVEVGCRRVAQGSGMLCGEWLTLSGTRGSTPRGSLTSDDDPAQWPSGWLAAPPIQAS